MKSLCHKNTHSKHKIKLFNQFVNQCSIEKSWNFVSLIHTFVQVHLTPNSLVRSSMLLRERTLLLIICFDLNPLFIELSALLNWFND